MKTHRYGIHLWFILACAVGILCFGTGEMAAFGQGQNTMSASALLKME
jgi:hypothetical protein